MKLDAGFVTNKLKETKDFYQRVLNFGITFENDFYVLMQTTRPGAAIAVPTPWRSFPATLVSTSI